MDIGLGRFVLETEEPQDPCGCPGDFAEWQGAVRLMGLTLEAVQSMDLPTDDFRPEGSAAGFGRRSLLTLLVYGLSRGIYGAQELEQRIPNDPDLRYLAVNRFPDWITLRQFRRHHAAAIEHCLANVLARCWDRESEPSAFPPGLRREAAARLRRAVQADSLALDV